MTGSKETKLAVSELNALSRFVTLCERGLGFAIRATEGVAAAREVATVLGEPELDPEEYASQLRVAEELQRFAQEQVPAGFSYLYNLATTHTWAILEAQVDHHALARLKDPSVRKDSEVLRGLTGPLLAFHDANEDEQADILLSELKMNVRAGLKLGVGRFESVLDPVGLGGHVDDLVRRVLLEHQQIRNLLLHRKGRVDGRFLRTITWLPYALGERVAVVEMHFHRYMYAAMWYTVEIERRLRAVTGSGSQKGIIELLPRLVAKLEWHEQNAKWPEEQRSA